MKKIVKIENLDCAHCAAKVEKAVNKIEGVTDCKVSFMAERMMLEYEDGADFDRILDSIRAAAKKVEPDCRVSV